MSVALQETGANAQYTDEELISKYFEIKGYVDRRQALLAEILKPCHEGMELIKNQLLARLNERGAKNTKTDAGTAFMSKLLDVKVVDRQAFLQHCIDHWADYGADMLQIGAVVGPVRDQMEKSETPPGLETSTTIRISIRKPS